MRGLKLRILKVWAVAALIALGISFIWDAFHVGPVLLSGMLVFLGVFVILISIPLVPWLFAERWLFSRR